MVKSELKLDNGNTIYIFDPEASFQGKTFISLSKSVKGFKGKKGKFQVITFKKENFRAFLEWFKKCLGF